LIISYLYVMYRDKNFPAFLKTEFFEKTQFFPFCCVRKYMAGYILIISRYAPVIPAEAGIRCVPDENMDSCFRRNDSGMPDLRPAA